MARKVNEDVIKKWEELREKQYSYKDIAEKTGWSKRTVAEYLKEEEEPTKNEKTQEGRIKKLEMIYSNLINRCGTIEEDIEQIYEDMPEEPALSLGDMEEHICTDCGEKGTLNLYYFCDKCKRRGVIKKW